MPMVEVSNGELIDKLTILDIKMAKISDVDKVCLAKDEYFKLLPIARELDIIPGSILYEQLYSINLRLWEVEDCIREFIAAEDYGQDFIDLAILIPKLNANRFNVKNKINELTKSEIREVKDYA